MSVKSHLNTEKMTREMIRKTSDMMLAMNIMLVNVLNISSCKGKKQLFIRIAVF